MIDKTRFERDCSYLHTKQQRDDISNLRKGTRIYHMHLRYGAGTIEAVSNEMNISKNSGYDYTRVAEFLWRWKRFRAWLVFEDHPALSYTHLREATLLEFESAIDALVHAETIGMTPSEFYYYVGELGGKPKQGKPLFKQRGLGVEVLRNLQTFAPSWAGQEVEITVKPIRRKRDSAGKE